MNIIVILHQPSHPGNIGAVVRAMKVMGLTNCVLIRPREFPSEVATAMAANAKDLLETVRVCDTLEEALQGCQWVMGASARSQRNLQQTVSNCREAMERLSQPPKKKSHFEGVKQVAWLFGNEQHGLDNASLSRCDELVTIPTSESYQSLNLAQAVQVFAYEYLCSRQANKLSDLAADESAAESHQAVDKGHLLAFQQYISDAALACEYTDHSSQDRFNKQLATALARAQWSQNDVDMLWGLFKQWQSK